MDTPDFKPVLEKLIELAPPENQGGCQCQVVLMNGATLAGALFRNPWDLPSVYGLRSVMRKGDPRSGEPSMVDSYFHSNAVFTVTLAAPEAAQPRIVTPSRMG